MVIDKEESVWLDTRTSMGRPLYQLGCAAC